MRLQIISDIHCEFHADRGVEFASTIPNECDILIVAGDLATKSTWGFVLPILIERFPEVIYIPGNHEYWGHSFEVFNSEVKLFEKETKNFHFLLNECVEIQGQRFVGSTLWFPETPQTFENRFSWSDFQRINDGAHSIYELNKISQAFLRSTVTKDDVVITHHLPTFQSIHEIFRDGSSNGFFLCPMGDLINDQSPKLWVHGHTHYSFDYLHSPSKTRIVCNPFGYAGPTINKVNQEFLDQKIVEI